MEFFKKVPTIRFMELRRYWYVLSALVVLGSIALVIFRGLNLTVDFTGGVEMEVGFAQPVDLEQPPGQLVTGGIREHRRLLPAAERALAWLEWVGGRSSSDGRYAHRSSLTVGVRLALVSEMS